jgi:dihydrolipoamide dehydrogenase
MKDKQIFDLVVIGAGPGGYVAAIKAAQMGLKVGLVEKKFVGGTCLNVGCIPTKSLLSNAEVYHTIKESAKFGIKVDGVSFDFFNMFERKNNVVSQLRSSLEGLIKANKITILYGQATFESPTCLKITAEEKYLVEAEKIIIATGSEPTDISAFPCDYKKIHNSTSILDLKELPKSLAVIGGGYIGCEFASLYQTLGVEVTIIEALDSIIAMQGKLLSSSLTQAFEKQKINIKTKAKVKAINKNDNGVEIILEDGNKIETKMALVSVGRSFTSSELNLEKAGVESSDKGIIKVNNQMQTNVSGIYAIGDVTGGWMLAHSASHEGLVAASNCAGKKAFMHYNAVPSVIFTHPEIASVGLTEEQAQEKEVSYVLGKYPFQALGKSVATAATEGFAYILADKKTKQIIGAHVIGKGASILIAEMALAIQNELTLECIIETIHAHPTLSEVWLEAALITNGTPLHFPPIKGNS